METRVALIGCVLVLIITAMLLAAGCTEITETGCSVLSGRDRDHCYQNIARISGNLELCEKIVDAGPASKCYIYVAKTSEIVQQCSAMEAEPWYRMDGAYTIKDCIMYYSTELRAPGMCDEIEEYYKGHATDLSRGLEVTRANCRAATKCGAQGQPACRTVSGYSLVERGDPAAFYCTVDQVKMFYPTDRTC